ncbi:MAG: hypothetical protein WCL18_03775 [bacterium]
MKKIREQLTTKIATTKRQKKILWYATIGEAIVIIGLIIRIITGNEYFAESPMYWPCVVMILLLITTVDAIRWKNSSIKEREKDLKEIDAFEEQIGHNSKLK